MQPAEPTTTTAGRTGPFGHPPLERPAPLREIVRERLLAMIVSRDLQPGHHLVENELAAALGVSRQPVREALLQLQAEGWVDQRPGQGTFVHNPTDKEADEQQQDGETEDALQHHQDPDQQLAETLDEAPDAVSVFVFRH